MQLLRLQDPVVRQSLQALRMGASSHHSSIAFHGQREPGSFAW
jgi:hypothetical protein